MFAAAVTLIGVAGAISASAAPASTLLEQKQAQLAAVHRQVHRLDLSVERLDERYNAAVLRTQMIDRRIAATTRALRRQQALLRDREGTLSDLLVSSYKGDWNGDTVMLVLGANDLGAFLDSYDVRARFDAAMAITVEQIRAARDAIVTHRRSLAADRREAVRSRKQIAQTRTSITAVLRQRRRLELQLGEQVVIALAADRIGQADLALQVRRWITLDLRSRLHAHEDVLPDRVALQGLAQIGVPYRWGGMSPQTGFDCSGLVSWLWAQDGVALPHFAAAQYAGGLHVDVSQLEIGDLVFFHKLGHVGIYVGRGYVLHAPHPGDFVRIEPLSNPWFQATYVGASRVIG
ncbi:MAG: peptidoglycan DL-endopeptidase CwlO [Gaiellales bacterium]|nr:peptidoglycan DL-endopeptidase CwlO [Gaiellales bacterium]